MEKIAGFVSHTVPFFFIKVYLSKNNNNRNKAYTSFPSIINYIITYYKNNTTQFYDILLQSSHLYII